jgi:hypothetical protein
VRSKLKSQSPTSEPTIVGFSESLDPLWVDLAINSDRWSGYTFRVSFDAAGATTGLDIRRTNAAADLTAVLLQRIPLGAIERAARRHVRQTFEPIIGGLGPESHARRRLEGILLQERPKRRDDASRAVMMARLAVRYVETLGRHDQLDVLGAEFGYGMTTMPKLIAKARNEYHYLTPTVRGRAGGQVTPEAYSVLTRHVVERRWATLTDEERAAELQQRASTRAKAAEVLERYKAGQITHEEWQAATFGQVFPTDDHGNVVLDFDKEV